MEEYKKKGIWLVLGILYKPSDYQIWNTFIEWLFQMTYYNEDDMIYQTAMNSDYNIALDGSFYDVNEILGCIQLRRNPQFAVYINIINIVDYLAATDLSNGFPYFYSILPDEHKESISKLKPESSRVNALP